MYASGFFGFGNYWIKQFLALDGTTEMICSCVSNEMAAG